jgi:hypothetical protein
MKTLKRTTAILALVVFAATIANAKQGVLQKAKDKAKAKKEAAAVKKDKKDNNGKKNEMMAVKGQGVPESTNKPTSVTK